MFLEMSSLHSSPWGHMKAGRGRGIVLRPPPRTELAFSFHQALRTVSLSEAHSQDRGCVPFSRSLWYGEHKTALPFVMPPPLTQLCMACKMVASSSQRRGPRMLPYQLPQLESGCHIHSPHTEEIPAPLQALREPSAAQLRTIWTWHYLSGFS